MDTSVLTPHFFNLSYFIPLILVVTILRFQGTKSIRGSLFIIPPHVFSYTKSATLPMENGATRIGHVIISSKGMLEVC